MSARLTVVFDDEELYRAAKVRAAEQGVPLKSLVESALREHLAGQPHAVADIEWDWAAYDAWQEEVARMESEPGVPAPSDLSDVKHHLYGHPRRSLRLLAEDPEPYGER